MADNRMAFPERVPVAGRAIGALDHQTRNAHGCGKMGRAGVEANHELAVFQYRSRASYGKLPCGKEAFAAPLGNDLLRHAALRRTTHYDQFRVGACQHATPDFRSEE